jgi:hypothetical protein
MVQAQITIRKHLIEFVFFCIYGTPISYFSPIYYTVIELLFFSILFSIHKDKNLIIAQYIFYWPRYVVVKRTDSIINKLIRKKLDPHQHWQRLELYILNNLKQNSIVVVIDSLDHTK